IATAEQPKANVDWWWGADKPFSFVAGCLELAAAIKTGRPEQFVTRLPVSFDASCSGAQHLCALTRANEGRLVNLASVETPQDPPQDLYETIADRVIDRLIATLDPNWNHIWVGPVALDRKLLKKITIAYLYGQDKGGTTGQITKKINENDFDPEE